MFCLHFVDNAQELLIQLAIKGEIAGFQAAKSFPIGDLTNAITLGDSSG